MSISMQFDSSKLDTQPGEALGKIGSAIGTLSGRTASAGSVKREMKGAIGENRAATAEANKQTARNSEIDHMVRKETIRAAVKHGAKLAATESTNRVNVSAFKAKETAKRSTMRTAATSKVRVEAAKQKTKSTPIARAPKPAAPAKPLKNTSAPKPTTAAKPRKV